MTHEATRLAEEAKRLLTVATNATFDCGEWSGESAAGDEEPERAYGPLAQAAIDAKTAVHAAIDALAALAQPAPTAEVALPAVSEEVESLISHTETVSEPGAALRVDVIHLTDAGRRALTSNVKAIPSARAQSAAKGDEARDAARWRTMRQRFVAVDWHWGGGEAGMGMAVAMFEIDPTLPVFAGPECADAFADCPLPTAPLPHENLPEAQA